MGVTLNREPTFHYDCWPLKRIFVWIGGITLGHHVFFKWPRQKISAWRVEHERVHVWQVERQGAVKFYLTYLAYLVRYGYKRNPYEVEARTLSGEP